MARKAPIVEVLRALFARSGNRCAFPGCTQLLVNERNQFIGQLCHIEAANPGGERWNENQTDEERRSYDNLVLLCYPHHVETNDEDTYTVEKLKELKLQHESGFHENLFKIDESLLYKLTQEMEEYWSEIEFLNTVKHVCAEFAVPVNANGTFLEIIKNVRDLVEDVDEVNRYFEESDELIMKEMLGFLRELGYDTAKVERVPYYKNPFSNRNWEMRNLRLRNTMTMLHVGLYQMELKYLEEYLKTNVDDAVARARLDELKEDFKTVAQTAGFAD